jgi:prepilin-type N-terminal cleavage/methylation domain-containing protein
MRIRHNHGIFGTRRAVRGHAGLTLIEVLVGMTLMAVIASATSILVGAATQSKMITATRSANTETTRRALDWMSERLRNAGLDLNPNAQSAARCKDRVVAQDAALLPTANSVYVSGAILNTSPTTPYQFDTIGYYLGSDPGTGTAVLMEYRQSCSSNLTDVANNSQPLSSPKIPVTNLTFTYFGPNGTQVTDLTTAASIQQIQMIQISITVQHAEGASGTETVTLTRYVTLRNPDPNVNGWVDVNEAY